MNRRHLLWIWAEPLPPTLKWIAPQAGPRGALGGHRGIFRTFVMLIGKTMLMWIHRGSVWMWVVNVWAEICWTTFLMGGGRQRR